MDLENISFVEEQHARYLADPSSVDPSWRHFFEGIEFASFLYAAQFTKEECDHRVWQLIQAYRRYGHLLAPINPIALCPPVPPACLSLERFGFKQEDLTKPFPTFGFTKTPTAPLSVLIEILTSIYSSRIGFEYMDLGNPELEQMIQERIEPSLAINLSVEEKRLILEALNQSELLESFLHTRFAGQKRFSLEGLETLIPVLFELIEEGGRLGIEEMFLGMAHRGRLNVLANLFKKPYSIIFREFEDTFYPLLTIEGSGDVKYHKGFSTKVKTRKGTDISLHLAANPSHLETVDPIVLGETRARQTQLKDQEKKRVLGILIHGDAAIAGQGIIYEILQLYRLEGYTTGGTLHIVLNNQIGFTTLVEEDRSTTYCTDIAKSFGAPVFHVNAEDPEACIFAAKLALEIRQKFQCDVFLDINGYRKYGHNEGDEPAYTQPLEYRLIREKTSIRQLYRNQLLSQGHLEHSLAESMETAFKEQLAKELAVAKAEADKPPDLKSAFGSFWKESVKAKIFDSFETKVDAAKLKQAFELGSLIPEGFHLHPKLQKWLDERKKMIQADPVEPSIDWGFAESLAFATLLLQGVPIRLAGQDARRGTFSHRHMAWVDQETSLRIIPLAQMSGAAHFELINSPLSEYAALGFEYGYSWIAPETLVLWEAQFGDFSNGAQIIIDQYIASAEQKWFLTSSLTLLLPHAFEGQGPEHSSARMERFLQMCANENMQIANVTTSAQFFHLLRRQALRSLKKPLIVFTPKSLLRAPICASPLNDFTQKNFEEVLDDPTPIRNAERILLCTGHVFYDLLEARTKRASKASIIRIEQIYPLHREKLKSLIERYPNAEKVIFVQEEPQNMGAWDYLRPLLQELLPSKLPISYAGRKRSASPAAGSHHVHEQELQALLDEAFR